VPPGHEQAWSDALAQEHLHQRELLATLRGELGTFAHECASALGALDAFVGLAGVAEIVSTAQAGVAHAKLVLEVGRRLSGHDARLVDIYAKVAGGEDVPPALVRHASDLLGSGRKRSDRELLQAVVGASGASSQVEQLLGPAPWAAIAALAPLVKWIRADDRKELLHTAGADLAQVLDATAALGAGVEAQAAADASALGQSLRDAVDHVEQAARSVREGELERVLREARERLQADLDALRAVHEGAHDAPAEWRAARRAEHAELTEEVHAKLEKIEQIRGILLRLLPHLQAVVRALGVVQRLHALEGKLDPGPAAAASAARSSLVLDLSALWEGLLPAAPAAAALPRPRGRGRWYAAGAVAAAAIVGVVAALALGGGSRHAAPPPPTTTAAAVTTTAAAAPVAPRPKLTAVSAVFSETARATTYTVSTEQGGEPVTSYAWTLSTPPGNPTCDKFHQVPGHPNEAVWHHASTDGCTHNGIQHDGTVHVRATSAHWSCTESFFGTLTRTGAPNAACVRS
jgi:hypothetical protein